MKGLLVKLFVVYCFQGIAFAQDTSTNKKSENSVILNNINSEDPNELPITAPESPDDDKNVDVSKRTAKNKHVNRILLLAGLNFTQDSRQLYDRDANALRSSDRNGLGFELLAGKGWDLRYHSSYFDVVFGYKKLLNAETYPYNVYPLKFGLFVRQRISKSAFWRMGCRAGFNFFQYKNSLYNVPEREFDIQASIEPTLAYSFSKLHFEIASDIFKIKESQNFLIWAFRAGLLL